MIIYGMSQTPYPCTPEDLCYILLDILILPSSGLFCHLSIHIFFIFSHPEIFHMPS
uniref:Uncharacterized protein n=1 Tax=Oryza brachyantha TaxID=4533 RepID=J3L577_ORYBR